MMRLLSNTATVHRLLSRILELDDDDDQRWARSHSFRPISIADGRKCDQPDGRHSPVHPIGIELMFGCCRLLFNRSSSSLCKTRTPHNFVNQTTASLSNYYVISHDASKTRNSMTCS